MKPRILWMMRRWPRPPLPPGDDVLLAVAWTCLPVATLSAAVSFSLPGAGSGAREESKHRTAETQASCPPCRGPSWAEVENNSKYQKPQKIFFFFWTRLSLLLWTEI